MNDTDPFRAASTDPARPKRPPGTWSVVLAAIEADGGPVRPHTEPPPRFQRVHLNTAVPTAPTSPPAPERGWLARAVGRFLR